ncbi:MAG: hypothetical protein R3C44_14665 [Chloroflexota bacterium]
MFSETQPFDFILIHSPLTGPEVWQPVADHLHNKGYAVIVPDLADSADDPRPFWQQHVESAVAAVHQQLRDPSRLVLAGHSGAGPILPALGARLPHPPAGYLFVDAGLPGTEPGSRLDYIRLEGDAPWADEFEQFLREGGRYPNWSEDDLRDELPEDQGRLVAGTLRPRGLTFFSEPLEPAPTLPDLPGGYLQWSPAYVSSADRADGMGWPVLRRPTGHFQMLIDPESVAEDILTLTGSVGA